MIRPTVIENIAIQQIITSVLSSSQMITPNVKDNVIIQSDDNTK
jgi:hypothetical protein